MPKLSHASRLGIALVFILLVLSSASVANADSPERRATTEAAECQAARKAVRYYVGHISRMLHVQGAEFRFRARSLKFCPRYHAKVMRAKAIATRKAHNKWLARERAKLLSRNPRVIALALLGGDRAQYNCLAYVVEHESNWIVTATNRYSGAYGIPQALPGSKMASHGSDWRTNARTQLRWMIDYMRGRYGSVCGAAYVRQTRGWY